jgi:hypothetical protein
MEDVVSGVEPLWGNIQGSVRRPHAVQAVASAASFDKIGVSKALGGRRTRGHAKQSSPDEQPDTRSGNAGVFPHLAVRASGVWCSRMVVLSYPSPRREPRECVTVSQHAKRIPSPCGSGFCGVVLTHGRTALPKPEAQAERLCCFSRWAWCRSRFQKGSGKNRDGRITGSGSQAEAPTFLHYGAWH